jgi:uncharacterized protein
VLIQFRVENHRSLRDEQTLSLVAGSEAAGGHVLRGAGASEALVPVAAIYGANASGKSNVLSAINFMVRSVRDSQRRWEVEAVPVEPFLLSRKQDEPSLYEADFLHGEIRMRYGFRVSLARVEAEWLFAWPHGRRSTLFERERDAFSFGKALRGENEAIRQLTRTNSLFLSAAAQNNHQLLLPVFRQVGRWRLAEPQRPRPTTASLALSKALAAGSPDRDAVLRLLREADTGIVDAVVKQATDWDSEDKLELWHRAFDESLVPLPLELESAGTMTLLRLAPLIAAALRQGRLLCIDELEASLHPALAAGVVRLFNDPVSNPNNAQLIFTTHDTNLLGTVTGSPALRRDQVWFTEKDGEGATTLYPLTDFHPRKEENLERGYLQGRYGAVPFLGDLVASPPKPDQEG